MARYTWIMPDGSIEGTREIVDPDTLNFQVPFCFKYVETPAEWAIGEEVPGDLVWFNIDQDRFEVRPTLIPSDPIEMIADGLDQVSINDLPAGTRFVLQHSDGTYAAQGVIADEPLVLGFTEPVDAVLQLEPPFPYRRQHIQVIAHD